MLPILLVILTASLLILFSQINRQNQKLRCYPKLFMPFSKVRLRTPFKISFPSFKIGKQEETQSKPELQEETVKPSPVTNEICCLSDIGKVRKLDEDSLFVTSIYSNCNGEITKKIFMIVADGMGGHSKGEVASALGATTVAGLMLPKIIMNTKETDYPSLLASCIKEANQTILQHSIQYPECEGMGTTMTAVLIDNQKLFLGHVGDTRAYLISEEKMVQLTKDHSLVQQMVDNGEITAEQARTHPQKNVITRVVGYYSEVDVDVYCVDWQKNDRVLLCCDGLTTHIEDCEIAKMVLSSDPPQTTCQNLVKMANDRGGKDNISIIITPPLNTLFEETK